MNKIDFYKFNWVFWKKKMNIFFWGIFPVADMKKGKKKKNLDSAPVFEH